MFYVYFLVYDFLLFLLVLYYIIWDLQSSHQWLLPVWVFFLFPQSSLCVFGFCFCFKSVSPFSPFVCVCVYALAYGRPMKRSFHQVCEFQSQTPGSDQTPVLMISFGNFIMKQQWLRLFWIVALKAVSKALLLQFFEIIVNFHQSVPVCKIWSLWDIKWWDWLWILWENWHCLDLSPVETGPSSCSDFFELFCCSLCINAWEWESGLYLGHTENDCLINNCDTVLWDTAQTKTKHTENL